MRGRAAETVLGRASGNRGRNVLVVCRGHLPWLCQCQRQYILTCGAVFSCFQWICLQSGRPSRTRDKERCSVIIRVRDRPTVMSPLCVSGRVRCAARARRPAPPGRASGRGSDQPVRTRRRAVDVDRVRRGCRRYRRGHSRSVVAACGRRRPSPQLLEIRCEGGVRPSFRFLRRRCVSSGSGPDGWSTPERRAHRGIDLTVGQRRRRVENGGDGSGDLSRCGDDGAQYTVLVCR